MCSVFTIHCRQVILLSDNSTGKSVLAVVIPCYNEEECLNTTANALLKVLSDLTEKEMIDENSFLLFVDDGSSDGTWEMIKGLSKTGNVKGIKLLKNYGHQNALLAGLTSVRDKCGCCVTIDADLQQDERAICEFIDKYRDGFDVVCGVRNKRRSGKLKAAAAGLFYRLSGLLGADMISGHADYRLLSNKVLRSLTGYAESNMFLRGIIPDLGFSSCIVRYDERDRYAGKTKYTFKKMLSLAIDGITSFSIRPIRLISLLGFLVFIISFIMSLYVFLTYMTNKDAVVTGWASTTLPIYFLGGIQLLCIGIIGEYIGKIYIEVKKRPRYFIDEET